MAINLTGYDTPENVTVTSFLANLPELLGSMFMDGSRILCISDFADFRYVQFWAEGGTLVAETISNMHLTESPLTSEQESALLDDGWNPPTEDGNPNFWIETRNVKEIPALCRIVQRAVTEVLGQGRSPELMMCHVKTWNPGNIEYLSRDVAQRQSRQRLQSPPDSSEGDNPPR